MIQLWWLWPKEARSGHHTKLEISTGGGLNRHFTFVPLSRSLLLESYKFGCSWIMALNLLSMALNLKCGSIIKFVAGQCSMSHPNQRRMNLARIVVKDKITVESISEFLAETLISDIYECALSTWIQTHNIMDSLMKKLITLQISPNFIRNWAQHYVK